MTQVIHSASMPQLREQPWLSSARWDGLFIIGPALISSALAVAARPWMDSFSHFPVWAWVCLVLLVDVAHVYATLFRTYLNRDAFERNRGLLVAIPLACWVVGAMLYSFDALFFWRALAYLAVFHFVRQQYGFVALYSRREPPMFHRFARLDEAMVYLATGYPLLYWHTHLPRSFNWFVEGDFASLPAICADVGLVCYLAVSAAYLAKECVLFRQTGFVNIPRNLLIAATAISWWVGIVSLNSDFAFTMTNVLAHGIPYMALVWLYHRRTESDDASGTDTSSSAWTKVVRGLLTYVPLFIGFLAVLAYVEEGLWDGFVWREHLQVFPLFDKLPQLNDPLLLALLIPLLALPQSTHYVLDGFIWRIKDINSTWSIWNHASGEQSHATS